MLGRRHRRSACARTCRSAPIYPAASIPRRWSRCSRSACRDTLQTFSIGFDDAGLDESAHQRTVVEHLRDRAQPRAVLDWPTSPRCFRARSVTPKARCCARRPRRCSCCRGLVRRSDVKVVLTGEGADEVLGGYDIFKEAKVRQFWAQQPESTWRPALLKRLYPYLDLTSRAERGLPEGILRRRPRRTRRSRASRTCRAGRPPAQCKLFWSDDFRAQRARARRSNGCATSLPGEMARLASRSTAPSTSRRRRCCRATCCPRRATAC